MSYPEPPGGPGPYSRDSMREPVESQYPPPPGEEDDRHARAYHQRAPSSGSVNLPSMSPYGHPQDSQYPPPPTQHNGYPPPDGRVYSRDPYAQVQPNPYREERGYPQDYNRGGQQPQMAFTQSAPRQRTAIACRYCRRRKIRCSGFDQNPEGRCSNCQRFQQECIFTPVSSQAQAFVPAHAVYPHMRGVQVGPDGQPRQAYPGNQPQAQIYGAHGQPLGPLPPQQTLHHPHSQQSHSLYGEYPMPSPTGSYSSFTDENQTSRKRPQADPHQQNLPPPIPGQPYPLRSQDIGNRRPPVETQTQDEYHNHLPPLTPTSQDSRGPPPQPASNYSPGSSTSSNGGGLHPPQGHGINMSRTPPPRSSPGGDNLTSNRQDPMSLERIVDNKRSETDIDRNMLGRLDRKN